MHPLHREIRDSIAKRAAESGSKYLPHGDNYCGSSKALYQLSTAIHHQIASEWVRCHQDLPLSEYLLVLDSLARSETTNEFWFIGSLLHRMPNIRRGISPRRVQRWLSRTEGWAEVDSICQSNFDADDLLSNWDKWRATLVATAQSENVHLRRASLVLLTKPVKDSDDARLAALAFENVERLKAEKDILITKAVSWILRALIKNHRQRVIDYLQANEATLPRIAIRETRVKLETGKKSGRLV